MQDHTQALKDDVKRAWHKWHAAHGEATAKALLERSRSTRSYRHPIMMSAPAIAPTTTPAAPEDQARATWDRDPAIRAEFGDKFETWAAYCKAVDRGAVNILGGVTKTAGN